MSSVTILLLYFLKMQQLKFAYNLILKAFQKERFKKKFGIIWGNTVDSFAYKNVFGSYFGEPRGFCFRLAYWSGRDTDKVVMPTR